MHLLRGTATIVVFLLSATSTIGPSAWARSNAGQTHTLFSPAIVIGFLGGYVHHDNLVHAEVQLAAELERAYPSGVHVEAFENHRGEKARQKILELLDTSHDGSLSAIEKRQARIILYGHSWGGSESIQLARKLGESGIPVLLTIQVDSIAKRGENDAVIPANVAQAANFYQPGGWIHGRKRIRAADPSRTEILGNFRFDYSTHQIACRNYPWWDRFLARPHTEIECDPVVWNRVEYLIRSTLAAMSHSSVAADPASRENLLLADPELSSAQF